MTCAALETLPHILAAISAASPTPPADGRWPDPAEPPAAIAARAAVALAYGQGLEWVDAIEVYLVDHAAPAGADAMAMLKKAHQLWLWLPEQATTRALPGGSSPSLRHVSTTGRLRWEVDAATGAVWIEVYRPVPWAVCGSGAPVIRVHCQPAGGGWRVASVAQGSPAVIAERHVDAMMDALSALVGDDEAWRCAKSIEVLLED